MQVPEEEKFLMTKDELLARLVTYMGGRAAEEIAFQTVTTGASNDIEQATKIAKAMILCLDKDEAKRAKGKTMAAELTASFPLY
jgi:ATP-dependent Zn protease